VKLTSILVPLDGTVRALSALPVAQTLAELEDATVDIVHVHGHEHPLPMHDLLTRLGVRADECGGCVVDQAIGSPEEQIARLAVERESDLLVLCTHTATHRQPGALGRTTQAVLARSACPVVLTRPDRGRKPWPLRRVVLVQNGTPASACAIDVAASIARSGEVELIVVHVAAPRVAQPAAPGTLTAPQYVDQPQYEWPAWGREFVDRLVALGHSPPSVRLHLVLAPGESGQDVVRVAREQHGDLLVLAWHGQLEDGHAAIVKTALREASCPVLVVRAPPEE
jgi:nucleotide-binding universal stress UspA family protein